MDPLHIESPAGVRWTTANVGEVVPGVMTPLTATLWGEHAERAGREVWRRLGILTRAEATSDDHADRLWGIAFGRAALNVTLMRKLGDRMPGTSADALEEQLLGGVGAGGVSRPTRQRYPAFAARVVPTALPSGWVVRRYRTRNDRWWREAVAVPPSDLRAAQTRIAEARRLFEDTMVAHVVVTFLAQGVFEQLRRAVERTDTSLLDLTTGYGAMEETGLLTDLAAVAQGRRPLEAFLADHGYHGRGEGEVSNPSWREQPAQLDNLVRQFASLGADRLPHAVESQRIAARERAERSLMAQLGPAQRVRTGAVLALGRRYIPLREVGKVAFLQAIDVLRQATRVAGAQLLADGRLDAAEHVFGLTLDELTGTIPPDAAALAQERLRRRDEYVALELPQTWTGAPAPRPAAPAATDDGAVRGLGVSAGVAEGMVRVVDDPDKEVEEGEILVCDTTDPSWAPLMFVSAGMVVNVGGALSHAAIVARELGVPCVINTGDGTKRLCDGDRVRIDGSSGTVEILARAQRQ